MDLTCALSRAWRSTVLPLTMRIAIDIDSTLHHYWDQLEEIAHRRFGVTIPYERPGGVGHRPAQARAALGGSSRSRTPRRTSSAPSPIRARSRRCAPGTRPATSSTSPPTAPARPTTRPTRWLRQIELPFDELYCSYDKVTRCQEIGIDVLIDDSPDNLRGAIDAGITAATLLHPWNRELCETEDVVCGEDWPELARNLEPVLR